MPRIVCNFAYLYSTIGMKKNILLAALLFPLALLAQHRPTDPFAAAKRAGLDTVYFTRIDSLCNSGIAQHIFPGCQVLVAYRGQVVYQRGYGRQTYEASSPMVNTHTVYDLASLTKVSATTFALMRLFDEHKIALDDPLSKHLPYLKGTNKERITIRQAMSHIARLKASEFYWKKVGPDGSRLSFPDAKGDIQQCRQQVLDLIARSDLNKDSKYVYSDLGFILLGDLVERVSGQPLDRYMADNFYRPLGMTSTSFRPRLNGIDTLRIAPTEVDNYFRHRLIRGEVHDQNCASMGGVAGHAGLFSTAHDLWMLYQMYLDSGSFRGKRYFAPSTAVTFNKQYFLSQGCRRALGFDKPYAQPRKGGSTAPEVSQASFGHTGFTGTMVWCDPKYNLVYIFLSNRTYPDSHAPNKLASSHLRQEIQSVAYQAILHPKKK